MSKPRVQDPASPFRADVLKNRVAFITGGGSGIGLDITKQLGLHGAKVFIMGRRKEVLDAAVTFLKSLQIDAAYATGDVRKPEEVFAAVKACVDIFGSLNMLVNSAAGNFLAVAEELSPKGFKTVMEIDTIGTFTVTQAAFPYLKASQDGVIINISATLQYGATPYQSHAAAAKAAIDSLTRSWALEWGDYNIKVNGIAPGPIADTAVRSLLGGKRVR
jgi:2,4-dienoyl-CoA reductase [(3E)-enoyl-CoA-producing], peroxisomal